MNASDNHRAASLVLVLTAAMALGGCVSRDVSDLEQYAQSVLARKGGRIEPLPEVKPYERYVYPCDKDSCRDPFVSFLEFLPADEGGKKKEMTEAQLQLAREAFERNKEELEQFELDSLRMVGTLENDATLWGIIQDTSGVVHRVQVGNYMGRNNGKIVSIEEDEIALREIVTDTNGDLVERSARIALAE